jgi:hypothetical protein
LAGTKKPATFLLMNIEHVLEWLKEHDLISINALEIKAGIPQRNLHKVLNGQRPLPVKYHKVLIKILKGYGYG